MLKLTRNLRKFPVKETLEPWRYNAGAYKSDPDFYEFVRTLDAYQKVIDDKTTLILSTDSELLDLMKGKK